MCSVAVLEFDSGLAVAMCVCVCLEDRGVEYRELAQREEELQKQLISLSEENMELKFEVEQANRDIPRLKVTFCRITYIS